MVSDVVSGERIRQYLVDLGVLLREIDLVSVISHGFVPPVLVTIKFAIFYRARPVGWNP